MKRLIVLSLLLCFLGLSCGLVNAQTRFISPSPVVEETATPEAEVVVSPKPDLTQKTEETLGPLEELLKNQVIGSTWPTNPVKYAIRGAISAGVPVNTIVLLLLLPVVATVIAITRQVLGIRGFGIFLPAALSVTFVAIGPIVGILLFVAIVAISTLVRMLTRKLKVRLQYLPKMALILWFVSFGILAILFTSPYIKYPALYNVSIFPVLILTLLTEDFTRIQLGKSVKTALRLTFQTLILSLVAYLFMTLKAFQEYVLLNPEITLLATFVVDIILGRFIGLRFMEYYRFRKLIKS